MTPISSSNAARNERAFRFLSYTLVFLMLVCAVMTVGTLINNVLPGWHTGILASVMLFIVIDRLYTFRQLKTLPPFSSEWAIAIGMQWVLILLVIRFLLSFAGGLDSFRADLSLFARGYIAELLTPEFVVAMLLALLVWFLSGRFLYILDEIGLDQAQALHEGSVRVETGTVPAHQRLVNLIFSIGIGLVILTTLARINYSTIGSNAGGLPNLEFTRFSGAEAGALLYFVFGLALLSLSRLMSLQTHWNRLRIPVSSRSLARQWGLYSLFFLLLLAVIVSLLPANGSLGLFSLLGSLIGFLIGILFFIMQLILILISLVFSLPFLLLRGEPASSVPSPRPLPTLPPVGPELPVTSSAAWELIRSILLWGSLIVIIVLSFIHFVRQHGGMGAAIREARITNWLLLAWQWLFRNVDKTRGSLSRAIADGWQNIVSRLETKRILPRPGLIRLRSLDPRRQIYFFYLAMIRRGGEQGLTRKPSQTPSEYAVRLEKELPAAGEDIEALTAAFVEARYSRQEVDSRKAALVKAIWGRIRRALQSKSASKQS